MARAATDLVPRDFLGEVGEGRTIARYGKNQPLFLQGGIADSVFYIHKGKVKISLISPQGKEAVVAILGKGEFCGEGCLSGRKRRIETATALTDCEAIRIEKNAVFRALHCDPAFSDKFIGHLLARTIRLEEDLVDQIFNSSEKRLARALLLLANSGKTGKSDTISAKVSQETLAEMIGTTRPRVSFFMNKFRKMGLITYGSEIRVHSALMNDMLRDQQPPRKKSRA